MRVRTPEEIKTYVEGYNACYEDFRRELKRKTLEGALETMEVINSAVMKLAQREETESNGNE